MVIGDEDVLFFFSSFLSSGKKKKKEKKNLRTREKQPADDNLFFAPLSPLGVRIYMLCSLVNARREKKSRTRGYLYTHSIIFYIAW